MRSELLWITAAVESRIYSDSKYIEQNLFYADLQDDDGYPTAEALEIIKRWGWDNRIGLFRFIESLWWTPSFGWHEKQEGDKLILNLSTGGWSGNESLIHALEENNSFAWHSCWVQSRVGGHYIFEVELSKWA